MVRSCPVCKEELADHEIVCSACQERIDARMPAHRRSVLWSWGRGLMLAMAILFFLKGSFAALSPEEYARTVADFGFTSRDVTATSVGSAFFLAAALLYGMAWIGGYLGRAWDKHVCLAALVVFGAGETVTRFLFLSGRDGLARGLALFVFWMAVPVFQYCIFRLAYQAAEPEGVGAPQRKPEEAGPG